LPPQVLEISLPQTLFSLLSPSCKLITQPYSMAIASYIQTSSSDLLAIMQTWWSSHNGNQMNSHALCLYLHHSYTSWYPIHTVVCWLGCAKCFT
jgi:hypothetical protein